MARQLQPSRRDLFRSAGLVGAASVLSGCGFVQSGFTGGRPAARTLTYWNLLGGGDGPRMKAMEAVYSKEHPEIDLQPSTLTWGNPYYTKLSLATLGAQPPDVAISHLTRVPTLVGADLLHPFPAEALERFGMTRDKFVERALDHATIDGEVYAIPLDTHPFVMFYNTDVCDKAGLLDSDGQLTSMDSPEQFVEVLAKTKEVTGSWGGAVASVAEYATPWRFFYSLYGQLGGKLLTGDAPEELLESEKALQAMNFMRRLTVDEELMPRDIDYGGAVALFANGRSGVFFQGEWEITTFQDAKLPFDMTRLPAVFGDTYAVQADSHTFVMPRRDDIDSTRIEMVLGFVRSMLDQSLAWAEGGHVPTWLPVQETEEYQKLRPQSNYASVAEDAIYDPPAWYSGSGSNLEMIAGASLGEVLTGRVEPERALDRIRQGWGKLARTASPI